MNPRKLEHGLGSPILYLKGMRISMFQLSGFYFRAKEFDFGAGSAPSCGPMLLQMALLISFPR